MAPASTTRPDALETYKSKRDFTKTAEPAGKVRRSKAKALSFVVQKHDATRLHYDFRLELDGVLLSWAVTKGPSTNPADKRLAVHVEDHPLDYGGFEGTIPEGQYGGGTVMLWDEGTWEPVGDPHEGLEKGDLKFILHGKRMKGSWVLVHMKGRDQKTKNGLRENWLLIKHQDEYATTTDGLTEKFTTSVETGRDLAGIAKGNKSRRKAATDWLKIKCIRRQELVIGGWRPSDKKSTFASLLLGTWEDGKLRYRGRVGTGFHADSAAELQSAMDKLARTTSPFADAPRDISRRAKWIEPSLVAEIAFTELTPDGHLRHPSFQGLRGDKKSRDVKLETPVDKPAPAKTTPKAKAMPKVALTDDMGIAAADKLGVHLTHPERAEYPGGPTKAQMIAYYAAVADRMLPHIVDRPLSLVRSPHGGIGHTFFQKHDSGGFPDEFKKVPIAEKDGKVDDYMYVENLAGIVAGVQMNTLEFHIWGSHVGSVEAADRIIFDIDPDEGLDFVATRQAALEFRDKLEAIGLKTYGMVTGGKGIHVIAPLKPTREWPEVKAFCKAFAEKLATDEPDRFTANIRKVNRKGRMFVDYLRNERGSTAIAPFSTRARDGAPCAVPLDWDEIATLDRANGFSLAEAAARAAGPDPWPDYFKQKQAITDRMMKAVGA